MPEEAQQPYTLKVKVGDAEFEASGAREAVQDQYALWLELVRGTRDEKPAVVKKDQAVAGGDEVEEISQSVLNRVFVTGPDDMISLRALPRGENAESDALLMLLYGYLVLRNAHDVSALNLIQAARQSGLQINRLDRTISTSAQHVQRGGARRGTRYSLNNAGIAHARRLVQELYQ